MRSPLAPSEHATVARLPPALSNVWSNETVAVADGAARAERAVRKTVAMGAKNIVKVVVSVWV